ncbi:hypothetical protein AAFF_G00199130 [Aldrovandia affinis]|uniref:ENTH domain-containing protein n=1 Tax=Aldrovandia affinis TaxID=143900 RepID=A0AAD7RIH3_9TELE|nr:hypothetical protein AAFF_G00199130 [Aldrovandia affinis]
MVHNYTEAEVKVREATSNDPWGAPSSLMSEISDLTFDAAALPEVMGMIWKRLNDHGKNWRHVYKALTLLEYLIRTGSDRVAQQSRENAVTLQTLRDFQHVDRDGKDQGASVREKARQVVGLMRDEEKLKRERTQALKTRQRTAGTATTATATTAATRGRPSSGYGDLPPPYPGRRSSQPSMSTVYGGERPRGSPSFSSSSSSPRRPSDLEEARPQTSGEEELQLQLALAMSREENEKPPLPVDTDEQVQLQMALNLSKDGTLQPAPPIPVAIEMDEDEQFQLALSLSKEEHQQEQRSREGDESLLLKALEESRREMEGGGGESAMMDLVDIFGPGPAAPPSVDPWALTATCAKPANVMTSDPWDSLGDRPITPVNDGSWIRPPAAGSPPNHWGPSPPPADPWEAPRSSPSLNPANQAWTSSADTGPSGVDPFGAVDEEPQALRDSAGLITSRAGSPTDGDLFGEPVTGVQVNGRDDDSLELFDMSCLREGLAEPTPRSCRTPESFLDPTAASLVNLDALISPNPASKVNNPFLTGLGAPSPSNPFQSEQPRLTLNQMRPVSPAPLPSSASLPMSLSHQPPGLPSSFTHPPTFPPSQGPLDILPSLPQPLLPLSAVVPPPGQHGDQQAQNPFL